ncbi:helicase with zinc finger domain 2-like isoform X2 [Physella acuta]|uniref:helicase with zinc finger domain 2-like isoform X2 n=1 Tax=Physella acuta TaxID=109671 RepID=UPI0027DDD2BB|nr:helicase with zinc finger domain 2-like isoform X2 [Physella acuta]
MTDNPDFIVGMNNFDDLVQELENLVGKEKEINTDWLKGPVETEKKKGAEKKKMPSKKKKGNGLGNVGQDSKSQSGSKAQNKGSNSDRDSDSTLSDDDAQFAAKMQSVKSQPKLNSAPVNAPLVGNIKTEPVKNTKPVQQKTSKVTSSDGFTTGKTKGSQQQKQPAVQIVWPLENYDFQLACKNCFIKEGEGIKGYRYKADYSHNCSHDLLLVRTKNSPSLNWLKIRPRDTKQVISMYFLCNQFKINEPCRLGEANCTFAHSQAEINLWTMDRDRTFNIQNFIRDAAKDGIYSSEVLEARGITPKTSISEQYIPGLQSVIGNKRQGTPPVQSPPPQNVYDLSSQRHVTPQGANFASNAGLSSFSATSAAARPGLLPNQGAYTSPPAQFLPPRPFQAFPTFTQAIPRHPTVVTRPPAPLRPSQPAFSSAMPNLSQPPPNIGKIKNPLPQFKFKLCCPQCLIFSGKPWYYSLNQSTHDCSQNMLAFYVQDTMGQNYWVQVRERSTHRTFKGFYVLCHSVRLGNLELCKFRNNCSFAHNSIEQKLWKCEQEGEFDIGEFILQNKQGYSPGTSNTELYIRHILEKFGGYFRFICRDCFFAPHPMISSEGDFNSCSGTASHSWSKSRILAHVKNTSFTPIDQPKFMHDSAFYLMCNHMQFCQYWLKNSCKYAHSLVEKAVWMMERDTKASREELVAMSAKLFQTLPAQPTAAPSSNSNPWGYKGPPRTIVPIVEIAESPSQTSVNLAEFCRTCWGKGQKSQEDGKKDKCVRGHNNFKVNSVFLSMPAGKEIRSLPPDLPLGMKLVLCEFHPKCTRRVCKHPHGQDELDVWTYMMKNRIKSLREVCDICKEMQKSRTTKINMGESVVNVMPENAARPVVTKQVNQIIAPGDLVINEHYCHYCGISCNSSRHWDEHCMSEVHINNVNSDKEHQWNYRQPPWAQGNNLALCAKHLHNESCQYSHVPDMYNLCKYAHSQEELDEWRERYEWRQMKRVVAKERHMFSYTESLLEEFYSENNSIRVICENLPDVRVVCDDDLVLYKNEKNAIFTWIFKVYTRKALEKVALLHNRDRLHFTLQGSDNSHHQVASGDSFIAADGGGNQYYKVNVNFTAGMFGSFSQWVIFDFGVRPVLVRKLAIEIGDHLKHEKVRELRENLAFDRWTSLNREIVRANEEVVDKFTEQLLQKYKEPVSSEDVVTQDSLADLNQHNYVHKMHKLLELEEITRHRIIAGYNMISEVTASQTLEEFEVFIIAKNGDLFIKLNLAENLSEDTLAGKLVLTSVRTVLLAPVGSKSKVYEANIVGQNNYGYDGRGKEHIYLVVSATVISALQLAPGKKTTLELQFQMDRTFFCRMHYALDNLQTTDVVFPDVVKFKPDINQMNASFKIKSSVLNEDQLTAVRHIVVPRDGYTPPFIMYGPFGTGKTETLAQATMTLLRERANARILICTQTNSAADLYITKHLDMFIKKSIKTWRILRLYAQERKRDSVPPEVLPYCHLSNDSFSIPSKEYFQSCQLVITTVETSIQLSMLGLHNQFTHIFVDEAGQALECEILIPLSLASNKTCVVLTGDHQQIGPTVYSPEAKRQKFDISILVRLFNYYDFIANCGISQMSEKSQHSPLNIFLSINYRTKPEILRFISSVFYGGPDNLKAYGQVPSVMGITPLMFYAVQGTETQNTDSTSYLNHAEAQEVVERVRDLLDNWPEQWGKREAKKVAVIATYSDQIKHIRKMLRTDRTRPYLASVDVGPMQSFQGKEVRALFISTVRTSNLLQEPHIVRALECGEDIGDLGFLSNPKLLNTALTRTQSFVAVVGDPVALCLIGECIQVWRTYLKHCSNMKSVWPQTLTYDVVKLQVIQIQMSPQGKIVDMISKRGQDVFKQTLRTHPLNSDTSHLDTDLHYLASGDAITNSSFQSQFEESIYKVMNSQSFDSVASANHNQEASGVLRVPKQLSVDELSMSSMISCEDIIFQLARENIIASETGDNGFIKSEGISIEEVDGFAVIEYSLEDSGSREPFKLTSKDDDFITFLVENEDSALNTVYENWSIKTMKSKLENEPNRYLKCLISIKDGTTSAIVLGSWPPQLKSIKGRDIDIQGQLNRGHALNGDVVLVELLGQSEDGKIQGQIKGILERAQEPKLIVCSADIDQPGILTPINSEMPCMYSLTSAARIKLARKGNVCVYRFVTTNCIEFSHFKSIDTLENSSNCLFIVRYLTWQAGFTLPLGVVVGLLNPDGTLEKGIKILDIEYNICQSLRPQALDESECLFPPGSAIPAHLLKNRKDLTSSFCFTINNPQTEDVEMAISVNQIDNCYEVGIHLSDIVAFVEKDSVLDQECEHRGASLFPIGKEPKHMLPSQVCTEFCSLKVGVDRLAVSVLINVDEAGNLVGGPEIFRSVINCKQRFSHTETEDILLSPEEAQEDYLKSCITVLYQLSYLWRSERLGNGHLNSDLGVEKQMAKHSYLMMNEVKIHFNSIIAELLLSRFRDSTPLLIQPSPAIEKLEQWRKKYACDAFNSIPLTKAFLDDQVCRCQERCTCVFSYLRKNQQKNTDFLSVLKDSWLMIVKAVSEDCMDFELAQDLISNSDNMPQLAVATLKLKEIEQPETFICSQYLNQSERYHYGLNLTAYTNCTNPLRRYISMVVQRLLVAYANGEVSPYTIEEINDICLQSSATKYNVDSYHRAVFQLNLCDALKSRPLKMTALVEDVDMEKAVLSFKGVSGVPKVSRTISLSLLSPVSVISFADQKSSQVQLKWEERVYVNGDSDYQTRSVSEIKLEPDRYICSISTLSWQRLLTAVREKDEPTIASHVQEISKQVGGESELLSISYPDVISHIGRDGSVRHFVPFTFSFHENQTLEMQISVDDKQGLITPCLQLLNISSGLDICLEHKTQPDKCFTNTQDINLNKITYSEEEKYAFESLLPILSLESSYQAVNEGDKVTIKNLCISWTKSNNSVLEDDSVQGEFFLSDEFCLRNEFQPDFGSNFEKQLYDGQPLHNTDCNYSLDFLCVRYSNLTIPDEPALDESVAVVVNNGQPITWVGHCQVKQVSRRADGFKVTISLIQSRMKIPTELLGDAADTIVCTVEWICKTKEQRILDVSIRGLRNASPFAKDIITGRRPTNTIDPVPQDSSVLPTSMSIEQEMVISDSYRQPFSTIVGGPGTGKSIMAARLAHLLAKGNQTADLVRQTRYQGYRTQLMICGPNEKSLDVITGYLKALNLAQVHIVRVYSEEIEERDYPLSLNPKPTLTVKPSLACAVMEDVALHHLIRKHTNPESKELLEQEMMMTLTGKQVVPLVQACLERAQTHELKKAQIIVCTCTTSARPVLRKAANIKQVIMDDAGFISEVESLVPLLIHKAVNQLILLGDLEMPEAHISNHLAAQHGLSRPLLQRCTQKAHKLHLQFRNLPTICSFPSNFFYKSILATSPKAVLHYPASTIPWPGEAGFPSVFCHLKGNESFAGGSQSKYRSEADLVNIQESQVVISIVDALIKQHKVQASSILVLTATQAQAALITQSTSNPIVVNTVLESIGQESDYVILSTVRTLPDSELQFPPTAKWTSQHIGEVANPRFVNLSITRAKAALFIIGDKDLLGSSHPWKCLLSTYRRRKSLQLDCTRFLQTLTL